MVTSVVILSKTESKANAKTSKKKILGDKYWHRMTPGLLNLENI